jgi:hypothetical protein
MSLIPEAQESLAPAEQPSLAPSGTDPADWLSLINPAGGVEAPRAAEALAQPVAPSSLEVAELVERWVRRVALGGDSRRGVARLDIGEGPYSGAELVVVAEPGHVSVELRLAGASPDSELAERVRARLERRGFAADVVVR